MTKASEPGGGRRRRARVAVLSSLYAYYSSGGAAEEVLAGILRKESLAVDPEAFARRLFTAAVNQAAAIDQVIRDFAANWEFNRIAAIDKNILRLAIAEIVYLKETPPRTAINEAIELARVYSTEEATKFVNGVLDAVYHHHNSISNADLDSQ